MARGDLLTFEEARKTILTGGWEPADEIWVGLVTNAFVPTAADAIPAYAAGGTTNYTAIATAGNYAAGGLLLDTYDNMVVEAGGLVTFDDTGASVSWAQAGANPQDAYYAIIYHKVTGLAICFVDLAGAIDMQAGDLTITWNGSGMFTINN